MVIQSKITLTSAVLRAIVGDALAVPDGANVSVTGVVYDGDDAPAFGQLADITLTVETDMDGARKIERRVKKLGIEEKSEDGQE